VKILLTNCKKILFILALLSLSFIYGCGYSVYTKADLPISEIYLRNVENNTLEPGLQDKMRRILYQTLVQNGFEINSSANRVIDVKITNYRLVTISEIGLNTLEYQLLLDVQATLYDNEGNKIKEIKASSPFNTYFRTIRDLQSLIADKNLAIESLFRDICESLVRDLIFLKSESKSLEK